MIKDRLIKTYERLYLYFLRKKKERAIREQKTLPGYVISIGNLTVGGTGKTPMVIEIAKEAKRRGYDVSILSRGYKGRLPGPVIVSCRTGPLVDAVDVGDEPVLMAEKLHGVPVVVCKDRYEAGIYAMQCFKEKPDLFILDDGYQHWRLKRDLDILLISGINPFGNRRLFPFGPLREPVEEIKRADILVITMADKCKRLDALIDELRLYAPFQPLYLARHVLKEIIRYRIDENGYPVEGEILIPDELRDKKFIAFAGIGNPESFRLTIQESGLNITDFITFMDHHDYKICELKDLSDKAHEKSAFLLTTEKDLVRTKGKLPPGEIFTLNIEISCERSFFDEIFRRIKLV
ncbi:MAG: tetraacyldisaccharide 4'-kinase [Thermodesulfovibrionales bacterium]|nr:tetraacyldisaccharide 4'-kinase [Thermodesulfovibrionales bacterium]